MIHAFSSKEKRNESISPERNNVPIVSTAVLRSFIANFRATSLTLAKLFREVKLHF